MTLMVVDMFGTEEGWCPWNDQMSLESHLATILCGFSVSDMR